MSGHSGPCSSEMKCDACFEAEYDMFMSIEDCEHGVPVWDQCDACIAIYEDQAMEHGW